MAYNTGKLITKDNAKLSVLKTDTGKCGFFISCAPKLFQTFWELLPDVKKLKRIQAEKH